MKYLILFCLLFSTSSFSDVHVRGYHRKNGTYVEPHMRSDPNETKSDNWTTRGNTNPYTGKQGTKDCEDDCANINLPVGVSDEQLFNFFCNKYFPDQEEKCYERLLDSDREKAIDFVLYVVEQRKDNPGSKSIEVATLSEADKEQIHKKDMSVAPIIPLGVFVAVVGVALLPVAVSPPSGTDGLSGLTNSLLRNGAGISVCTSAVVAGAALALTGIYLINE